MNRLKLHVRLLVVLSCLSVPVTTLAIGQWIKGTVTKAPWEGEYTYIQVDNVRYTIMKNTDVVYVYTKNGAQYKDKMHISSIRPGAVLLVKVEGNRIYQIEKIR